MSDSISALQFDVPLSQVATGFKSNQYICNDVAKLVPATKANGVFIKFGFDHLKDPGTTKRAPGALATEVQDNMLSDTFKCEGYSKEEKVPLEFQVNASVGKQLKKRAAKIVSEQLMIAREKALATSVFNTVGNYSTLKKDSWASSTGNYVWDNALGLPITNIETAKLAINGVLNVNPMDMTLIITPEVFAALNVNPQIAGRLTSSGSKDVSYTGYITLDNLKTILGIKNIIVGNAQYHTGAADATTPTLTRMWTPKNALLCYIPDEPAMNELDNQPSLAYTFWYDGLNAGLGQDLSILIDERFEQASKSDVIQANMYYDMKFVGQNAAGYLFSGALT